MISSAVASQGDGVLPSAVRIGIGLAVTFGRRRPVNGTQITNTATIVGTILANGTAGTLGGSGGGIWLSAQQFSIGSGTLKAEGGTGGSKGGGGGRIALTGWTRDEGGGTLSVAPGGTGTSTGEVGTIVRQPTAGGWLLTVGWDPQRHGMATPYDYGSTVVSNGMTVTNSITLTAEEANGFRYICREWTLTNMAGFVTSGSPTQAVFVMDTNLFLTWYWTNQYYLTATAGTNGTLLVEKTGWYTNGAVVQVQAVPDGGYAFLQWTGTGVPTGSQTNNPLTLTMDRARDVLAVFVASGSSVSRTWTGANNWFTTTNWSPAGIPAPGDTVIVKSGTCLLGDPVTVADVAISNGAALVCSNWNTTLQASNVTIYGILTHVQNSATTTNALGVWVPDARVSIVCVTLTVKTNGIIDVNGKGYAGGTGVYGRGKGPGSGGGMTGGGHGGYAGVVWPPGLTGGVTNGAVAAPDGPGSGGGGGESGGAGGAGGGAIRIEASGTVTIDGRVTANGNSVDGTGGANKGAGSGGALYLSCPMLLGSGLLMANGGAYTTYSWTGGGGGGRIAILCSDVSGWTGIVQVAGGATYGVTTYGGWNGQPGTLYVTDNRILRNTMNNQIFRLSGVGSCRFSSLTVSNAYLGFEEPGCVVVVTNDMSCTNSSVMLNYEGPSIGTANLQVGGSLRLSQGSVVRMGRDGDTNAVNLQVGGNLSLSNSCQLWLYSGITNSSVAPSGGVMRVAQEVSLSSNSAICLYSHPTNGGSLYVELRNLAIGTGCTVSAASAGFAGRYKANGWGPGGGLVPYHPGGGGYGGHGGQNVSAGGALGGGTYGNSNAPALPGSAGGGQEGTGYGSRGGGLIWVNASGDINLDGSLNANGQNGATSGGGGSGGGIYLVCRRFKGAGTLTAIGGNDASNAGKGGGGRIAVWSVSRDGFTGTASAAKGSGTVGDTGATDGTIVWGLRMTPGTVLSLR
jgi:hypothetical protein